MPDWYRTIRIARYAGIPGPEFVRLPLYWQDIYAEAFVAENEATEAEVTVE